MDFHRVRRARLWLAVCLTGFLLFQPCIAQETESAPATTDKPHVSVTGDTYGSPNLQPHELLPYGTLLGDNEFRNRQREGGFEFGVFYTGEFAANATGERKGAGYAGQLAVNADLDFAKLMGADGLSAHFLVLNRHGNNLSANDLGDHVTLATEVYSDTYGAKARLVHGYLQQNFDEDRVSIAGGRLPFNNDFANSLLACIAVSLTPACPLPRALANEPGYTAFPQGGWGARGRIRFGDSFYAQTGAYLVEDLPYGGPYGVDIFRRTNGVLIPVEIGSDTTAVVPGLPGHFKLGFAHDTSRYPDLYLTESGQPIGLGNDLPGRSIKGQNGVWLIGDQMIVSHGERGHGLILMGSYGHSSQDTSFTSDTAFLSLIDRGSVPNRPDDIIQISMSRYGISPRSQDLARAFQLAASSYDPSALQRREYIAELNYTTSFIRGTTFQPALQYFLHPNAQSNKKNALVFALRITARL